MIAERIKEINASSQDSAIVQKQQLEVRVSQEMTKIQPAAISVDALQSKIPETSSTRSEVSQRKADQEHT